MSKAKDTSSEETYTVVSSMKANEAMTVRDATSGTTYDVVEYVDDLLRERMGALERGATVTLELVPVADCTTIVQATQLRPGGLSQPGLGGVGEL